MAEANPNDSTITNEGLADFAALADPGSIAGGSASRFHGADDREHDEVIASLRSELQRRARQIESLSRGLAEAEAGATESLSEADQAMRAEINTLKQQLDASNLAAREAHGQLAERDAALESSRRDQQQLRRTLERMQREFEDYASERSRVRELSTDLSNRATSLQMLTEERDGLRGTVASVRQDLENATDKLQHVRNQLAETRERLVARETDANALRGALVATQKQAQARECEVNELKTALSIASETVASRREEFGALTVEHARVVQSLSSADERAASLDRELEAANAKARDLTRERDAQNVELARSRRELEERETEVARLRERIDDRDRQNHELRERVGLAEKEVRSLTDDLERERSELATEREEAAQRGQLLSELRETLAAIGKAVSLAPVGETVITAEPRAIAAADDEAAASVPTPIVAMTAAEEPETKSVESDASFEAVVDVVPEVEEIPVESDEASFETTSDTTDKTLPLLIPLVPRRSQHPRPPIFRVWRDEQVAKRVGPLGVSSADDFFAHAIAPIIEDNPGEIIDVLSLGGDDIEFELRIAQNLRRRGRDAFRIHYPALDDERAEALIRQAGLVGIDNELVPYTRDATAPLDEKCFRAIVSDGALSRSERLEPLIEALRGAVARGTVATVAEPTGLVPNDVAREMGDRIWQLMPERYKTNVLTGHADSHYWSPDAPTPLNPDLRGLLRAHFTLADETAFGHLIDRFVGCEIGPNFDPEDERDIRFIDQIASLDATKLDAGAVEPLHLIARLAPRKTL